MTRIIFLLVALLGTCVAASVSAATVQGTFATGQAYAAQYSIADAKNADGMNIERLTIAVKLNGSADVSTYTYDADAPPVVRASTLGFLLIAVNSGGMEGSTAYNYLIPVNGKVSSIGVVNINFHLGKTESIEVVRDNEVEAKAIDSAIAKIISFRPAEFSRNENPYPGSALLFLGHVDYRSIDGYGSLVRLLSNQEISGDPKYVEKLKTTLGTGNVDAQEGHSSEKTKTIINNKAYLLSDPGAYGVERGYLIKGDKVTLIERSSDGRYWKVRYMSPKRGQIERWIRCEDVDYCGR